IIGKAIVEPSEIEKYTAITLNNRLWSTHFLNGLLQSSLTPSHKSQYVDKAIDNGDEFYLPSLLTYLLEQGTDSQIQALVDYVLIFAPSTSAYILETLAPKITIQMKEIVEKIMGRTSDMWIKNACMDILERLTGH